MRASDVFFEAVRSSFFLLFFLSFVGRAARSEAGRGRKYRFMGTKFSQPPMVHMVALCYRTWEMCLVVFHHDDPCVRCPFDCRSVLLLFLVCQQTLIFVSESIHMVLSRL